MTADDLAKQLRRLLERLARAADLLDREDFDEASTIAEEAIMALTGTLEEGWERLETSTLLRKVGEPERGRALARALWIASTVDELQGRTDRASARCLRAMELYARLRLGSEELDVRAARELGSASRRLGATQNVRR